MRVYHSESGISLVETAVALAILGLVSIVFLSGLATTSRVNYISDDVGTAASLALLQTEAVKVADYIQGATQYDPSPLPADKDYTGYSVTVAAQSIHIPDDGIQRIKVDIYHSGRLVYSLQSYKADR